jgi:predicted dehydrogenase
MSDLNIAIVGCGYWGINYVRLITHMHTTKLVAVCDKSKERLEEVKRRFPGPKLFEEVDELLSLEESIDAAIICTSPSSHFQIASKFLDFGKPVLVEKPITDKSETAKELVDLAKSKNLTLMVGHIFLYNPAVEKLKTYINDDDLGKIYYLYARRTNLGPIRKNVNALWDLAPHDISMFNYFLDEMPKSVSAVGTHFLRDSLEDVGFITLRYQKNVIANIHVSWADPHKVRETVVVGSKKRIVFDDTSATDKISVFEKGVSAKIVEPKSYGEYQLSIRNGDIIIPHIGIGEPLKRQVEHFLDCVSKGRKPLTDGVNGLQIVQVMEAIEASMQQNGTPVKVGSV